MIPKIKDATGEKGFIQSVFKQQVVETLFSYVGIYDNGTKSSRKRSFACFLWMNNANEWIKLSNRSVLNGFKQWFALNDPLSYMPTLENTQASVCGSFLSSCAPVSIIQNSKR